MRKISFLVLTALFLSGIVRGQQVSDVHMRQQLSVVYKSPQKWNVTGKYFLYLEDNVTRFSKSVLGLELNYKILPWLEAGAEYRYAIDYLQDEHIFRYALEGAYDPKLRKYELKLRTMLEQSLDYFDRDYLAAHPIENTWRNRLLAGYEINKKVDVYLMTELYLGWKNQRAGLGQSNYGIGADYELKRRHGFNLELQYRDYHLKKKNADVVRLEVGYKLSLGYQKPKKKKKKARPDAGVEERLGE